MDFIKTAIEGLIIVKPKVFQDDRGYFFETYNETVFAANGIKTCFIQDNQSKSFYGVVRGLHCQLGRFSQAKLVRVLAGRVLDVAVDVRKGSKTFGQYLSMELSGDNQLQLFIPKHFLHGFAVLSSEAVFAYKVDEPWCKEAEFCVRYDDPTINVDWKLPKDKIITAAKDKINNQLEDLLKYDQ